MIIGLVILGIIVLIVIVVIGMYNSLIRLNVGVDEAYSTMDVYLKKRYDLVPNLVETVKGYAKHEKSTFEAITNARSSIGKAQNIDDKLKAQNMLTDTLKSLFAVAESYPELKANQNFISLQNELQSLEVDIANSRKYYNAMVKEYNIAIAVFPRNILANMFGFKKRDMFSVESTQERQNVKVQF